MEVGGPGWDEAILDFVMFGNSVLRMKHSATAGKICAIRYFHAIHGRPDFTTACARYKMLLKSITQKLPCIQKLPYNIGLLQWLYRQIHSIGQWATKVQEMWGVVNLGFYLLRSSEIKQARQKDIEISVDEGGGETDFVYIPVKDGSKSARALSGSNGKRY